MGASSVRQPGRCPEPVSLVSSSLVNPHHLLVAMAEVADAVLGD